MTVRLYCLTNAEHENNNTTSIIAKNKCHWQKYTDYHRKSFIISEMLQLFTEVTMEKKW